jgi:hypothetical protein
VREGAGGAGGGLEGEGEFGVHCSSPIKYENDCRALYYFQIE